MRFFRSALLVPFIILFTVSGPATAETILRMGLASLPNGNGNPFTSSARTSAYTYRALFDTLTQLGSNLAIEPGLALSWDRTDVFPFILNTVL
jgi:hypothetical protein